MAAVIPQQQQQQQQPKSSWRGFSTTSQNTIKTEFPDRIVGPSVWDGKALEQKPEEWIYHVTAEDIADIERGLQHFKASGVDLVRSGSLMYYKASKLTQHAIRLIFLPKTSH